MITLSNGKKLLFLMASGMMGFDGKGATIAHRTMYKTMKFFGLYDPSLFTIITKTVTLRHVKGSKKIRPLRNGWWNNWGLDNPGLFSFLEKYAPLLKKKDNIILSIMPVTLAQACVMAKSINDLLPNIFAVELNVSCPNIENIENGFQKDTGLIIDLCHQLNSLLKAPLLLKIGCKNDYLKIAEKTEKVIEALDINSVPTVDQLGAGAISGEFAQFVNWRILQKLVDETSTPVIGPSIWHYEDIKRLFEMGASAISFGSISMIHPRRPWSPLLSTAYVRKYKDTKKEKISG